MSLPDRRPTYVGQPQPLPGWPTIEGQVMPYQSTDTVPVEDRRVVGYEKYAGMLVPVYETRQAVSASQQRDLTPLPLIDPLAARAVGFGVGAGAAGAGIGWGFGQAAMGIATFGGTSAIVALALLLLAAKLPIARGGTSTTQIHNETHNHNRWWGSSSTDN